MVVIVWPALVEGISRRPGSVLDWAVRRSPHKTGPDSRLALTPFQRVTGSTHRAEVVSRPTYPMSTWTQQKMLSLMIWRACTASHTRNRAHDNMHPILSPVHGELNGSVSWEGAKTWDENDAISAAGDVYCTRNGC